jgi:hypothetical protein
MYTEKSKVNTPGEVKTATLSNNKQKWYTLLTQSAHPAVVLILILLPKLTL